jgi:phospholipase/carboxylesterase
MTRSLESKNRAAKSGQTNSVVIFLHGYGADGPDLLGLADPLADHLPNTAFYAPNAPERSVANPMGFQWFPIPYIDNSSEEEAAEGLLRATGDLNAYLDEVMEAEGVEASDVALVGFSQGTMMALHVAPEMLEDEVVSKPPVLLIHGDADDVVPPQSLPEAGNALTAVGFDVFAHVSKGTCHGIAPDGLSVALAFLREKLGYDGQ